MSGQHHRPNVLDEQIFRRRIPVIWLEHNELFRNAARSTNRSNGVRIPSHHKMYIPQIWCVRIDTETRFTMLAAVEHSQRKDVHFHLVLVHHIVGVVVRPDHISVSV